MIAAILLWFKTYRLWLEIGAAVAALTAFGVLWHSYDARLEAKGAHKVIAVAAKAAAQDAVRDKAAPVAAQAAAAKAVEKSQAKAVEAQAALATATTKASNDDPPLAACLRMQLPPDVLRNLPN